MYNISLIKPFLTFFVITSTTIANTNSDNMDPWCTPTFTSNFSIYSSLTLSLVFASSYKLITTLTITSGINFFLVAHSNTYLGTLSNSFSRSTKHIYTTSPCLSIPLAASSEGMNIYKMRHTCENFLTVYLSQDCQYVT